MEEKYAYETLSNPKMKASRNQKREKHKMDQYPKIKWEIWS